MKQFLQTGINHGDRFFLSDSKICKDCTELSCWECGYLEDCPHPDRSCTECAQNQNRSCKNYDSAPPIMDMDYFERDDQMYEFL